MNTLRAHRKARKFTQKELADITGVDRTRICLIELGDLPSVRNARILATYFGVKIEAMFPGGMQTSAPRGYFPKGVPKKVREEPYCPPLPQPVVYYLSHCPRCQARAIGTRSCYACGGAVEIWPMEEAHV